MTKCFVQVTATSKALSHIHVYGFYWWNWWKLSRECPVLSLVDDYL